MKLIDKFKEYRLFNKVAKTYFKLMEEGEYVLALASQQNNLRNFTKDQYIQHVQLRVVHAYAYLDDYENMCSEMEKLTDKKCIVFAYYYKLLYAIDTNAPNLEEFYEKFLTLAKKESDLFKFFIKESGELMRFCRHNKPVSKDIIKHFYRFRAPVAQRILKKIENCG